MPDKEKRKTNPRRRLLLRMLLGIAIIAALIPIVIKQFEPEHLYLVYKSYDDETLAPNLYLYDVTRNETVRQLTDNAGDNPIYFDTSENAPYVIYQYYSQDENYLLMLIDLRTGRENILIEANELDGLKFISLHPDGQSFAYQIDDEASREIKTYIINITSRDKQLIHTHDWNAEITSPFAFVRGSSLQWVNDSLMMTFVKDRTHASYAYDLQSSEITHILDTPIISTVDYPNFSSDGNFAFYLASDTPPTYVVINLDTDTILSTREIADGLDSIYSDRSLSWRPDTQTLLQVQGDINSSGTQWYLALLDTQSGTLSLINNNPQYNHFDGIWNADGSYLLYRRANSQCEGMLEVCGEMIAHDMETGEETLLPYYSNMHWVRIP